MDSGSLPEMHIATAMEQGYTVTIAKEDNKYFDRKRAPWRMSPHRESQSPYGLLRFPVRF
jgi:hypothetical protein